MVSAYRNCLGWMAAVKSSVLCGLVCAAIFGCSSQPPEKSAEDIEKARQQHINTMQREAQGAKQ